MKSNILKSILFSFLVLLFIGLVRDLQAQSKLSAADSAEVVVMAVMEKHQTPGISVSVSVGGELVWSKGFGYADMEAMTEVDPGLTMFRVGSVSKTLTAATLGQLYEQGKIDFDNEVQVYTPDFPKKKYPITVRQVAGHTAGIRHYRGDEFMSDKYYATVEEGLTIFENDPLLFEPDTRYSYSSYGWNLMSAIIENASDKKFLDYMIEVFDAMGMDHTMADIAAEDIPNRTHFYYVDNGTVKEAPYVDNSYKWAGGGFIGTSEDLVRFGNVYLDNDFTSEATFNMLTKSHTLKDGSKTNYGIGWRSGINDQGMVWVGHSGGSVGGITMFAIYPEQDLVVAMCSNSSDHGWDGIHHVLASLFAEN